MVVLNFTVFACDAHSRPKAHAIALLADKLQDDPVITVL
jgi:hypothetical protein